MSMTVLIKILGMGVILCLSLYHDIREQKIKNVVTLPGAVFGLLINTYERGFDGCIFSLKGWIGPILLLAALHMINAMGGGDIKLFSAIGSIMGLNFALYSITFSVYIGGVIAVGLLLARKQLLSRVYRVLAYLGSMLRTGLIFPYCQKGDTESKFIFSTAIVPGTILQLLWSVLG